MAAIDILTKDDLQQFRQQLLEDIKNIIAVPGTQMKQWLKSDEVRKLLRISASTLQTLRINGTLSYSRVGRIMYYKREEILKLLEGGQR
ncbi:helix-turn-helix domain-containing protein [Mucilaginibacter sp. 21P]|uniref:helix-turn-helix domain-containing protein n=1 Tax=Mucilaginibacter sp. 21P TaxID=2778902 RepID=UPI001C58C6B8|nr:helix-turn-helix domain-containing protein [Mucilaginibacter sp. 21P]QXV66858.1 helix-turn-helix domain-containing protein [Mucilaginibacter sp. 21P]